ncbi:MAG: Flp pilus assembly complex ATPase component TadA [Planctomycetes bacterium]|nr:Flp pilus assembly complex ATPase component TadA [Planctomycetota bacterium]
MKRLFKKNEPDIDYSKAIDLDAGQTELSPGLRNLYCPQQASIKARIRDVVDILIEEGTLEQSQADEVRSNQSTSGTELEKLLEQKGIDEEAFVRAKAKLYGFEFKNLVAEEIDREAFGLLELKYIRSNYLMPIKINEDGTLMVATTNPSNVFAIDDVKRLTNMNVDVVVCTKQDIEAICEALDDTKFDYNVDEIMTDMDDVELIQDNEEDVEDLEKSAGESPVIKFVNYLLSNALHEGASDIHIEPKEKYTKIRYRIDGVLFDSRQAPSKMHAAIVSRIKIMSNLDISERRIPQDGKIAVIMGGRGIDLRVSVLPTCHGEKVVIRLLDSKSIMISLEQSGMETRLLDAFQEQIAQPHGILLVTGPTGSGKSTTLYSALAQMDSDRLNVSTVEDPVEYNLEFCNQVQVNERTGLTFSGALRSLLRQDPDIIMIGEIRDTETSRIAVQAALTGHLVLSTLHTNDAPSSISRLVNIGIEPYLIAASLNGVLAQRLVRRICEHCKEPFTAPDNLQKYLDIAQIQPHELMHGKGCDKCRNSGYSGRCGIHELLVVDDEFRQIINADATVNNMRKAFRQSGWPNLFEDGLQKVKRGITTIEEILRVAEVADAADSLSDNAESYCNENNPPQCGDNEPVYQEQG